MKFQMHAWQIYDRDTTTWRLSVFLYTYFIIVGVPQLLCPRARFLLWNVTWQFTILRTIFRDDFTTYQLCCMRIIYQFILCQKQKRYCIVIMMRISQRIVLREFYVYYCPWFSAHPNPRVDQMTNKQIL